MPYLFRWKTFDHREVEWEFPLDDDGNPVRPWGDSGYYVLPDDRDLPLRFRQISNQDQIPDFLNCCGQSHLIVSAAAREVLVNLEPNGHLFFDVEFELKNGRVAKEEFFWWKCRNPLEGCIDVEKSDVSTSKTPKGTIVGLAATSVWPSIFWYQKCVEGRHMWVDKDLDTHVFVSDRLAAAFKEKNLNYMFLTEGGMTQS